MRGHSELRRLVITLTSPSTRHKTALHHVILEHDQTRILMLIYLYNNSYVYGIMNNKQMHCSIVLCSASQHCAVCCIEAVPVVVHTVATTHVHRVHDTSTE